MTKNENAGGGWCKASVVLGVIAVVIALLPLLSGWLMFLTFVNYLIVPIGVICGVVAIVKSQNLVKSIIGLALCVLGLALPFMLAEKYAESAVESVGNALETVGNTIETVEALDDSESAEEAAEALDNLYD